jgi:hypothetical protein
MRPEEFLVQEVTTASRGRTDALFVPPALGWQRRCGRYVRIGAEVASRDRPRTL